MDLRHIWVLKSIGPGDLTGLEGNKGEQLRMIYRFLSWGSRRIVV